MKVCLIQLEVGRSDESLESRLNHIQNIISKFVSKDSFVDLILLPETAFSQYCFPTEEDAQRRGLDEVNIFEFSQRIAILYSCYFVFGCVGLHLDSHTPQNMLKIVSPQGKLIHQQIKRFLYDSDRKWTSHSGDTFPVVELQLRNHRTVRTMFAICNDINGKTFSEEDMKAHSLATAALHGSVEVVFLLAAWCSAHPDSPAEYHDAPITKASQLEYWLERLKPLWGRPVAFCVADLVGREPIGNGKRIRYCGTTCAIDMQHIKLIGEPRDTETEGGLIVDIL